MIQKHSSRKGLPIVTCECGEEILVIPDIEEMVRSIEAHSTIHEKREADAKKGKLEYYRIEEQLSRKVIIKIADITNDYK